MSKKQPDDLAIISLKTDSKNPQQPSKDLRRWKDVRDEIIEVLRLGGYPPTITSRFGQSCWILEPTQPWRRGTIKVSIEVLIEEDEQSSQAPESPLDDIRNLSEADS